MTGARPAYPGSFVGVDLETTGLDSRTDAIIEVAAVRMVDGKPDGEFESFVNPGRQIPADIVYLTGITDEDVSAAPSIGEVLPGLVDFVAGDPIVAHNASFDAAFLREAAAGNASLIVGEAGVYDTLALARALVPRLPSHRLAALVDFFGIEHGRAHRAASDARAVARLFLELLGTLDQVGSALLARMASLADEPLRSLVEAAREHAAGDRDPLAVPDFGEKEGLLLRYDSVRGSGERSEPRDEKLEVDLDAIDGLFESGGAISEELQGFEPRREQSEMTRAVGDCLNSGVHLVVEAGTGVGKSLAYLVPAIEFAALNGRRVVVSTNTKNLQEQLFLKDIPFLERTLDREFSVSLLKGRGNYLCLERWRRLGERGLSAGEKADLLPIVIWEQETRSGDISENTGFGRRPYLWSRISSEGGPCLGQKCPFSDECYLMNARRASQRAHIVIVNHSLLFSDTETGNRILGEYSYLVCDEAHNIEAVATEHLGRRAKVWRARAALDNVYRKDGGESGAVRDLLDALPGEEGAGIQATIRTAAERLSGGVLRSLSLSESFFAALAERHRELNEGQDVEFGRLRYRPESSVGGILSRELADAVDALRATAEQAERLADLVADSGLEKTESHVQSLEFHAGRLRELADDLSYLASADDRDAVFWLDVRTYRSGLECELRSAPVSVAEKMADFLYSKVDTLVLTSATLTVDGSFDFIMERLGLDLLPDWSVVTLNVGSPYDYDAQAVVAVAAHLPQPSSPGFNRIVANLLVDLAAPSTGGTLALFTSRASLDAVFKACRDPLTARGKLVLAQGHSGGASAILDEFGRVEDSILLATSSFWEGVDVPGRSLEQLLIVKLPFPVPRDPVVEAHCERYEADGERAFDRYMVPRTAIRLRQGFGRLIRSTTDEGCVIFLDSRLATRAYGERLLDQLPTRALIVRSDAELLSAVGAGDTGVEDR